MRDENDTPFMVKLFPAPRCSCKILGRSKCAHLLAVMQVNGQPITDGYKLPELSQLRRSKRDGKLNGRKRRGHRRNAKKAIDPTTSSSSNHIDSGSELAEDDSESGEGDIAMKINHYCKNYNKKNFIRLSINTLKEK